ncbi:MAG: phosphoglucomutase (alpha-D-glucose-1,6-bisphosphate-dependent) [Burkholderiaceae bacterium]|jgi:phosphoglucomutase|nr:phosphoglucomutase (alpha-D-glucose-1,6-bisphosphate-dependent) [Burkholderiaceae bacterium]
MSAGHSPLAGQRLPESALADLDALRTAYFDRRPDSSVAEQRVRFGTSGHRGSSLRGTFNEWHVLAIAQAICDERRARGIEGPLFIGFDTHALSRPAFESALEVLAANQVAVRTATGDEYTPTPAISHAILGWNRDASAARADGIVVTPSHNPPEDGGFKYNPPHGGPAGTEVTAAIERRANAYLGQSLAGVHRVPFERARASRQVREHDFRSAYVDDLACVVDFDLVRGAGLRLAVDPLGGAGVHYWRAIAARHRIALDVVSEEVDPRFAFMTADWDGRIRMDPSSPWAMRRLLSLQDRYDVAFACDTDHDRHGVVVPKAGLMPANHYLSVVAHSLFASRTGWPRDAALGKTLVSTAMLDRVAAKFGRRVVETPVGFKWFVDGLLDASLGFAGEESAGATVLRRDGTVWTTDKDGIALALLAAELTARDGRDPGRSYAALEEELGRAYSDRVEAPADAAQRAALAALHADAIGVATLAGEPVRAVLDRAPGNDAPIGGIKVVADRGWFAARPSGTEDIYKIYAESFVDEAHLREILAQAQAVVDAALGKTR